MEPPQTHYALRTAEGKPAAGVLVYRYGQSAGRGMVLSAPEHADAQGRIPRAPTFYKGVIVLPPTGPLSVLPFPQDRAPLVLAQAATALTLTLVDEKGKPRTGVVLTLLPTTETGALDGTIQGWGSEALPDPLARQLTRTTDKDGRAVWAGLPHGARLGLNVCLPGENSRILKGAVALSGIPQTTVPTLVLARDGVIEGRVYRKRDGKPLAGIEVSLSEPGEGLRPYTGHTTTDARGQYRFSGLLLAPYSLFVQAPDRWLAQPEGPLPALTSLRRQVRYDQAVVKPAILSGTIIGPDGWPVHGAILWVEERGGGSGQQASIEGKAQQALLPGDYRVGWSRSGGSGAERDLRRITLAEGETRVLRFGPEPRARFARAPEVELQEINGTRTRLSAFRGRVVVVQLTSQGYEDRLPALDAFVRRSGVVGLVVDVGQDTPLRPQGRALRFFRDREGKVQKAFALGGWPTCFVIDAHGALRAQLTPAQETGELEAVWKSIGQPRTRKTD